MSAIATVIEDPVEEALADAERLLGVEAGFLLSRWAASSDVRHLEALAVAAADIARRIRAG